MLKIFEEVFKFAGNRKVTVFKKALILDDFAIIKRVMPLAMLIKLRLVSRNLLSTKSAMLNRPMILFNSKVSSKILEFFVDLKNACKVHRFHHLVDHR